MEETLEGKNLDAAKLRSIKSQITIIARVIKFVIIILAASLILVQFQVVRTIGVSILASIGIAGIVIGFALQKTVANLFAGLQILFTQPVRIGDEVIVEGEWGWIEDIGLTYVVVRIWDLRRLIIPISYFLERPFQNWTKVSPDILGTVFVYCNYNTNIDEMRHALDEILKTTSLWDGKVKVIQVTDLKDRMIEVRILVSARSAPEAWDLRCYVREKILKFLQQNGGRYLPTLRVEMDGLTNFRRMREL